MRLCVGCGTMQPKKDLIRVLKNAEGEIKLDFTGKHSGRGAYLCKNMDCFAAAKKGHRIDKRPIASCFKSVAKIRLFPITANFMHTIFSFIFQFST